MAFAAPGGKPAKPAVTSAAASCPRVGPVDPGAAPVPVPRVLVRTVAGRQVVVAACATATARGVRLGMTLVEARAVCATLGHDDHDPAADARGLLALARWSIGQFSPVVAIEPPNALLIDVTGSERLFGQMDALVARARQKFDALRIGYRLAVAPTPGGAWALAGFGPAGLGPAGLGPAGLGPAGLGTTGLGTALCRPAGIGPPGIGPPGLGPALCRPAGLGTAGAHVNPTDGSITASEQLPAALGPLPVAALRLDEPVVTALATLGVRTIAQVIDLPRHALPARFGQGLLLRLDQALGRVPEPLVPVEMVVRVRAKIEFGGVVESVETFCYALERLLDDVLLALAGQGWGARVMVVSFVRERRPMIDKTVTLSRPTRSRKIIFNLLRSTLETVQTDAGFVAMKLAVPGFERVCDDQLEYAPDEAAVRAEEIDQLVGRLRVRLTEDAVVQARLCASHLPERAYRFCPLPGQDDAPRATDTDLPPARPRPLQVLATPVEIRCVFTPVAPGRERLLLFHHRSHTHTVRTTNGPERIAGLWWEGRRKTRDYYEVEDDTGRRFWLFQVVQTRRWFLQGVFGE